MTTSRREPLLADTLRVLLPDAEQTLILRTCLCDGPRASESWRAWSAARPDLQATLDANPPGLKRLLPLLHAALVEKAIAVDAPTMAVLRAAALWEERRAERVREILGEVLAALDAAGVSPVLWKGVAVAETVYPRPELRHCHDIDLLVTPSEVARAVAALKPCGFSAAPPHVARGAHVGLVHEDGLPVSLHVAPPGVRHFDLPRADMAARAATMLLAGQAAKLLRPLDALLCLSAHVAAGSVRDSASWVTDAAFLLRAAAPDDPEWERLAEMAAASGLAPPLHVMLAYLRDEIGVTVSECATRRIGERAAATGARKRDVLLLTARRGRRLGDLVRQSGWRSRLDIARWLVAPSPAFLKAWCAERGYPWTPLWYVARPLRRLVGRAGTRLRLVNVPNEEADSIADLAEPAPSDGDDALLSSVRLATFGLRREPPRPADDRTRDYDELFDYDTLYYDVFRSGDGSKVICAGPPLLGCEEALAAMTYSLPGEARVLTARYHPPRRHLQPTHRVFLSGEGLADAKSIVLRLNGAEIEVPIRPSGRARFAGRRVVTTLSKDNPLDWIVDWATFNIRVHGADAIILYDNGSTRYAPADIAKRLSGLEGLADILVVPWSFPYGPGVGPRNVQDSFYCQPGQLDHARRRYCEGARAVLNVDIDELVVSARGESLFDRVEKSDKAAFVFPGTWVEIVDRGQGAGSALRHTDFVYRRRRLAWQWWSRFAAVLRGLGIAREAIDRSLSRWDSSGRPALRTKWVAVPGRCGEHVEWGVHGVQVFSEEGCLEEAHRSDRPADTVFRHFRQLTVGPNPGRRIVHRYSPFRFMRDRQLEAAFDIAFPGRRPRGRDRAGPGT